MRIFRRSNVMMLTGFPDPAYIRKSKQDLVTQGLIQQRGARTAWMS
jgi:hypothetical protein